MKTHLRLTVFRGVEASVFTGPKDVRQYGEMYAKRRLPLAVGG